MTPAPLRRALCAVVTLAGPADPLDLPSLEP